MGTAHGKYTLRKKSKKKTKSKKVTENERGNDEPVSNNLPHKLEVGTNGDNDTKNVLEKNPTVSEVHAVQPLEMALVSEEATLPCPVEVEDQPQKKPCASGTTRIEDKKGTDDIKDRTDNIHINITEQKEEALFAYSDPEPLPTFDKNIAPDYCVDLLESQPVYQDYQRLSDEIHQKLNRVCTHDVSGLLVMPLRNNGVAIYGVNAKSIELEIVEALEDAKLSKIEVRNIYTSKDKISYTDYLTGSVTKLLFKSGKWKSDRKTVCELIAKAEDRSDTTDDKQSVYCVVPAHLILSSEEIGNAPCLYGNMSDIREQVENQTTFKYEFRNGGHSTAVDLQPPPLFAHRQWDIGQARQQQDLSEDANETYEHHASFMNDIALLKFKIYVSDPLADKADIFAIPTSKHLDLLAHRQQGIIVGDLEGRLLYPPRSVGVSNEKFGLRLAFVITSKDSNGKTLKLKKGDSGLTVFLKGKEDQRFPVGMLVGKFSQEIKDFGSDIYQAVVLSQALNEIAHDYKNIISDIKLLEICHVTPVTQKMLGTQKKGVFDGLISLKNQAMQAMSKTLQHAPVPKRQGKTVRSCYRPSESIEPRRRIRRGATLSMKSRYPLSEPLELPEPPELPEPRRKPIRRPRLPTPDEPSSEPFILQIESSEAYMSRTRTSSTFISSDERPVPPLDLVVSIQATEEERP